VRDQVVGNLDALVGRPQHEVAGVQDEVVAVLDERFGDVVVDLVLGVRVNTGDVRPLELEELSTQSEVDACGLDLQFRVVEGSTTRSPASRRSRMSASERIIPCQSEYGALNFPVRSRGSTEALRCTPTSRLERSPNGSDSPDESRTLSLAIRSRSCELSENLSQTA